MSARKFHKIWIEQCDAAEEIKTRYGLKAAFDYLVADIEDDALDKEAEPIFESPAAAAERARRFATLRELLTAAELGTS